MKVTKILVKSKIVLDKVFIYTNLTSPSRKRFPCGDAILTIKVDINTGVAWAAKNFPGVKIHIIRTEV